jgi:hypothetical protein
VLNTGGESAAANDTSRPVKEISASHSKPFFLASKFLGTSVTEKTTERAPKEIRAGTAGGVENIKFDGACGAPRQVTGSCTTHPAFYQYTINDKQQTTYNQQPTVNSQT